MPATPSAQILLDHHVRIEEVLYIPGALSDGHTEQFAEFADNLPSDEAHPLFAALPELADFAGDDEPDPAAIAGALRHHDGFLVLAATPFRRRDGDAIRYNWGMVHTAWLFAVDQPAIVTNSIAWAAAAGAQDLAEKAPAR